MVIEKNVIIDNENKIMNGVNILNNVRNKKLLMPSKTIVTDVN